MQDSYYAQRLFPRVIDDLIVPIRQDQPKSHWQRSKIFPHESGERLLRQHLASRVHGFFHSIRGVLIVCSDVPPD